ncbi:MULTISPECIES: dTMP kinase [unclassified Gordonia (in: high G+C Gram-positive bacteria)]|uniref:dTMP kinase n=1 Tax=unclassified Gordonia (in: high G+C Gram-positive bacteria) TaxID=2657482 RepID=UPI00080E3954|nr:MULTISPECIES: dTMP kinase [unclassified Gordonia (in: high G+C Gram-positive bacteria)]MCT1354000.1 dTMP kinase [Gordonia sp. p3-SID1431]OCH80006.1 thymidylate kinase [Gordonia sp. UCD-TK1]
MGQLIAVEGLDGAGKNTLVTGLIDRWSAAGLRVATFTFPRYGRSATADIAAEALHGSHGDLRDSVYAMALLFALDRAGAVEDIHAATEAHDIVILDRYVASNAAYNAARLEQGAGGEMVRWVVDLEFGRFDMPVPDRHVLLGVSPEVAMQRAASRADQDAARARDAYERDDALQRRVDAVYRELAEDAWMSPWHLFDGEDVAGLADELRTDRTAPTE